MQCCVCLQLVGKLIVTNPLGDQRGIHIASDCNEDACSMAFWALRPRAVGYQLLPAFRVKDVPASGTTRSISTGKTFGADAADVVLAVLVNDGVLLGNLSGARGG